MVTILPPENDLGGQIGRAFTQGYNETNLPRVQQQYNQRRLQEAFTNIPQNGNFLDTIKALAPQLLTTPGGAQALEAIAGPLAAQAQAQAYQQSIQNFRNRRGGEQGNVPQGMPVSANAPMQSAGPAQGAPSAGTDFRNPVAPNEPYHPFPDIAAGPTPLPLMTPRDVEDYAADLMQNSAASGKPIPYTEALNAANQKSNSIIQYNQQIEKEKQAIDEAQKSVTDAMVARAQNRGLITSPEFETAARKFSLEARNAPNDEARWEYVRTKMCDMTQAQNNLVRNYQAPGPFQSAYQKALGSYKDKETAAKQAQPFLDFYRKNGLYDEARSLLSSEVGLGPEDIESWLFPMSKEQKSQLSKIPKNEVKTQEQLVPDFRLPKGIQRKVEGLSEEGFVNLKDFIGTYLRDNPGANLITLRGYLNQEKNYSWQDIAKAINELEDERAFRPDSVQNSQMGIVNNAPLPGLAEQFKWMWTGTK